VSQQLMDKRAQHLATLGCAPDASWEEVTQTYKDLMRVWHPDRFQSDERLRKKAEQQAQRINHAMSELRKMPKSPTTPTAHAAEQTEPAQSFKRPQANPFSSTSTINARPRAARHTQSQSSTFDFSIPPLSIRPRLIPSLTRITFGLALLYLCYDSLNRTHTNPLNTAFILGIAFFSIDLTVRSMRPILTRHPVVSVDRHGLFCLKAGWINWIDIDTVWPVITPRANQLRIFFSRHYLSKRNLPARLWLKLLRFWNAPHLVVSFSSLAALPTDVVGAMRLRQHHNEVELRDIPRNNTGALTITTVFSVASCATPVIRSVLGTQPTLEQVVPYLAIFFLSQTVSYFIRLRRSAQAING
jgi:hypothetical protein